MRPTFITHFPVVPQWPGGQVAPLVTPVYTRSLLRQQTGAEIPAMQQCGYWLLGPGHTHTRPQPNHSPHPFSTLAELTILTLDSQPTWTNFLKDKRAIFCYILFTYPASFIVLNMFVMWLLKKLKRFNICKLANIYFLCVAWMAEWVWDPSWKNIPQSTIHIEHTVSPLWCRLSYQVSTSSPPPDKLHRDFVWLSLLPWPITPISHKNLFFSC